MIDDALPSSKSFAGFQLVDNKLFIEENSEIISYDILSGKVVDTYEIVKSFSHLKRGFTTNQVGDIFAVDNSGIHMIKKTETKVQTIINDKSYAFADPSIETNEVTLLSDQTTGKIMLLLELTDGLKIFEYHFDENISPIKSENLTIWVLENGRINNKLLRETISVFSKNYPNCEINLEFGMDTSTFIATPEEKAQLSEDAIQKLNVELIAGDVPDILILDGLLVDTLYHKGFLSNMNLEIDDSKYYETILKSYTLNENTYAYPISFSISVLANDGNLSNLKQLNTLEAIADLNQNPNDIQGFYDYKLLFDVFFYASYQDIFTDYQTINENALKEFLVQTKRIAANDDILNFSQGLTPTIAEVLSNLSSAQMLFSSHENVEIIPLLEGNFIAQNIVSIPENGTNKEMAEKFIQLMLSKQIQERQQEFFSVMKDVQFEYSKASQKPDYEIPEEFAKDFKNIENEVSDLLAFDWNKLINSCTNVVEKDYLMESIIYEQAVQLYDGTISIDKALAECMKKISIIIAERN